MIRHVEMTRVPVVPVIVTFVLYLVFWPIVLSSNVSKDIG